MISIKRSRLAVAILALMWIAFLQRASADTINFSDPVTFTVTKIVEQPGTAKVSLLIGGAFVDVMVTVAATDTPADVAAKIAAQVPGATVNGATVTFPRRVDGLLFITKPVNKSIEGTAALVGFNMLPGPTSRRTCLRRRSGHW